jgi:5-methylcytosine-specific restriction endonuclease McrA
VNEREMRLRECVTCRKVFYPRWAQIDAGAGLFCSQRCNTKSHVAMNAPEAKAKAQAGFRIAIAEGRAGHRSGPDNWKWKGGAEAYRRRLLESGVLAERVRKYRQENPHKVREFSQRRKGRKLEKLPRGTIPALGDAQRWKCAVCRTSVRKGYHVDHIQPLARGGKHEPLNLQLLCGSCNVRKSAKDPIAFMQSRGFLL